MFRYSTADMVFHTETYTPGQPRNNPQKSISFPIKNKPNILKEPNLKYGVIIENNLRNQKMLYSQDKNLPLNDTRRYKVLRIKKNCKTMNEGFFIKTMNPIEKKPSR